MHRLVQNTYIKYSVKVMQLKIKYVKKTDVGHLSVADIFWKKVIDIRNVQSQCRGEIR